MCKALVGENFALSEQWEGLWRTYDNMLLYVRKNVRDPQRQEIRDDITTRLYTLTDSAYITAMQPSGNELIFTRRRELAQRKLSNLLNELKESERQLQIAQEVPAERRDKKSVIALSRACELAETNVFNKIWSEFPLTGDDAALLADALTDTALPSHARCLMATALLLGLTQFYDERKWQLLAETYIASTDAEVQLRCLMGAMLSMTLYSNRVGKSQVVASRIKLMQDTPQFKDDTRLIRLQMARTAVTPAVTDRVKNDIMPGLANIDPELLQKIRSDGPASIDISDLEGNPDWQDWLEQSGVSEKIEQFNEMQMAGDDVFISTFCKLKDFAFFKTLSNWFLPFHADHSELLESLGESAILSKFTSTIPVLCNSDKYSLCLSLTALPEKQRSEMLTYLESQWSGYEEQLHQELAGELPDPSKERAAIINRYAQDLYRFFTLFSRRNEFLSHADHADFKNLCFDISCGRRFLRIFSASSASSARDCGELYLKNKFFEQAVACFKKAIAEGEQDVEVYQKMAFALQNAGKFDEAIEAYRTYELATGDSLWNTRHLAACYRAKGDLAHALEYYRKAEALAPDNLSICLNVGHCLLEQSDTEGALQQYFKAEMTLDGKQRAWRPIAWCSLILKNYTRALNYYDKIIAEGRPTAQDLLNRGHVLLCQDDYEAAIAQYVAAAKALPGNKAQAFRQNFENDMQVLRERVAAPDDLPIIADAVVQQIDARS